VRLRWRRLGLLKLTLVALLDNSKKPNRTNLARAQFHATNAASALGASVAPRRARYATGVHVTRLKTTHTAHWNTTLCRFAVSGSKIESRSDGTPLRFRVLCPGAERTNQSLCVLRSPVWYEGVTHIQFDWVMKHTPASKKGAQSCLSNRCVLAWCAYNIIHFIYI
jgi:hypothetical protein